MIMHNPAHPGEVLQDYMGNIEVTSFAQQIGVSRTTLSRLLHGKSGVSAYGSPSRCDSQDFPQFWLGMQMQYDLWRAMQAEKAARKKARAAAPSRVTARKPRAKRTPS